MLTQLENNNHDKSRYINIASFVYGFELNSLSLPSN